eukprot:16099674-Heterocapsa_arctica.AAC.1
MEMTNCKSVATPSEPKIVEDTTAPLDKDDHAKYRRLIGKMMYASAVRPDVSYTMKSEEAREA